MTGLNATVNYGGGYVVYGLIQTNVCAEPGDSGGTTFFQPVTEALSAYGVSVFQFPRTSRPGALAVAAALALSLVGQSVPAAATGTPAAPAFARAAAYDVPRDLPVRRRQVVPDLGHGREPPQTGHDRVRPGR